MRLPTLPVTTAGGVLVVMNLCPSCSWHNHFLQPTPSGGRMTGGKRRCNSYADTTVAAFLDRHVTCDFCPPLYAMPGGGEGGAARRQTMAGRRYSDIFFSLSSAVPASFILIRPNIAYPSEKRCDGEMATACGGSMRQRRATWHSPGEKAVAWYVVWKVTICIDDMHTLTTVQAFPPFSVFPGGEPLPKRISTGGSAILR